MATRVKLEYGVIFGKGDSSDWIGYEITLTGEAEAAYLEEMAKPEEERCFSKHPELVAALEDAVADVRDTAQADLCEAGDEYAESFHDPGDRMEAFEIEDLVDEGDADVIAFFGLAGLDEDALDAWKEKLSDMDSGELPFWGDVYPDMEDSSPFDEGYDLSVRYADDPDCSY